MSLQGKACLSVIEARNVYADNVAEPNFYVRLRIGTSEVKTDVVKGSLSPKFLKDVRLPVLNVELDVLKVELLQVGPRGDLVVGCEDVLVRSFALRGTFVHWFELKTSSKEVGAELCMVIRYISAGGNRSVSPSYAIAARQERDRALDRPQAPPPSNAKMFDSGVSEPASSPAASQATTSAPAQPKTPPRAAPAPAKPPLVTPAVPGRPPSQLKRTPKRRSDTSLPMPLAIASGMLVGALVYLLKRKPSRARVPDDDLLCSVGTCDYEYIARRKKELGLL